MYIESNPGELGFPKHHFGPGGNSGWRHHMEAGGPGSGMMVQTQPGSVPNAGMMPHMHPHPMHRRHGHRIHGAEGVEFMAAAPPAMPAPAVMTPVSEHSDTAMYVATAALVLGLGFVIYKATR